MKWLISCFIRSSFSLLQDGILYVASTWQGVVILCLGVFLLRKNILLRLAFLGVLYYGVLEDGKLRKWIVLTCYESVEKTSSYVTSLGKKLVGIPPADPKQEVQDLLQKGMDFYRGKSQMAHPRSVLKEKVVWPEVTKPKPKETKPKAKKKESFLSRTRAKLDLLSKSSLLFPLYLFSLPFTSPKKKLEIKANSLLDRSRKLAKKGKIDRSRALSKKRAQPLLL